MPQPYWLTFLHPFYFVFQSSVPICLFLIYSIFCKDYLLQSIANELPLSHRNIQIPDLNTSSYYHTGKVIRQMFSINIEILTLLLVHHQSLHHLLPFLIRNHYRHTICYLKAHSDPFTSMDIHVPYSISLQPHSGNCWINHYFISTIHQNFIIFVEIKTIPLMPYVLNV